jgi:hypothetical protein
MVLSRPGGFEVASHHRHVGDPHKNFRNKWTTVHDNVSFWSCIVILKKLVTSASSAQESRQSRYPRNIASQNHNSRSHTAYTCQTQPPHAGESPRPPKHIQEKSLARLLPPSDIKSFSLADDARKSPRDAPSEGHGHGPRWYSGAYCKIWMATHVNCEQIGQMFRYTST